MIPPFFNFYLLFFKKFEKCVATEQFCPFNIIGDLLSQITFGGIYHERNRDSIILSKRKT